MNKKAQTTFMRNVIIGLILIVVLIGIIIILSGQAARWLDYILNLLGI